MGKIEISWDVINCFLETIYMNVHAIRILLITILNTSIQYNYGKN